MKTEAITIPKHLQKEEYRFVLLGKWDEYMHQKTKEKKKFYPETAAELEEIKKDWTVLGKAPFEKDWQKKGYKYNDPKLLAHIKSGKNYGVIGGDGELRMRDIDDDQEYCKTVLEETNSFAVKTGSGGLHVYFKSPYATNHVLTNGELRATNYQVVGPTCIHPLGKRYEVVKDLSILEVDEKTTIDLIKPFMKEASSTTKLEPVKKTDKSRSGKEFGEVCKLIEKGLSDEEINKEMMAFAKWGSSSDQYKEITLKNARKEISGKASQKGKKKENEKKKEIIISKETSEKFKDGNLLKLIHKELSKNHLEDDKLKMTAFLVAVSGLLENQRRRMSLALKGDSSVGKDNILLTVLRHIPDELYILVTHATQATIEDDIKDKRIIAFSEINLNKEDGANKHLVEVIKQKAEGGTKSLKKDIREGMKKSRYEVGEQGTVFYGTTEVEKDKEVDTRFIEGFVEVSETKIRRVNENTLDNISDLDKLFGDRENDSWIKEGLNYLFNKKEQYEVVLPFANLLKEEIDGHLIFDNKSPRSQRDLKRLLSLTCAMTYLFQEQRNKIEYKGRHILVGEPQDFINTLRFTVELFNQTYTGLDMRLLQVLKIVDGTKEEWVARDYIQEKIECSTNTIKSYCGLLSKEGCLKGIKGAELNEQIGLKTYDGNRIYYTRYQKGIKKPLIRCQVSELKDFLEKMTKKPIDTLEDQWFTDDKKEEKEEKGIKNKGVKTTPTDTLSDKNSIIIENPPEKHPSEAHFDTLKLTPYSSTIVQEVTKVANSEAQK